jgi:MFS family permease
MATTLRPIFSLLLGLLFLIVGHGMQIAFIPLRAEAEGWTKFEIGTLGSAYYIGYVLGCLAGPHLIRRAGHIRAFTILSSLVAAAILAHSLWVAFLPWTVFRLVFGASLAGLYMIIESWVNDRASNTNRGLIMSAYIMVNYGALALGQFLVTLASPLGFSLFAVAAMTMSISAIPLALTRQTPPAPVAIVRFRPLTLYRSSPVGFIGASASGLANGAFWSLGAVAAVGVGLSVRDAAAFMGVVTAAGAIAQWPAGRISDRVDRRLVLTTILVAAAIFGLVFAFVPLHGAAWFVVAALYGGAIAPTYSLSAAHAYDHAQPGTMVETAAGLFIASASGSIIGPLIASAMMQHLGSPKLFLFTAIVHVVLAAYVISRIRKRQAVAPALKTGFDLSASTVGGGIPPEAPPPDPNAPPPHLHDDLPQNPQPVGERESPPGSQSGPQPSQDGSQPG